MAKKKTSDLQKDFPVAFKLGFQAGTEIRSSGLKVKTVSKRFVNPYPKESPEFSAFDFGKLEGYSKVPRTLEFLPQPGEIGITCPKCESQDKDLEWSEWEDHIWCNSCKNETKDFAWRPDEETLKSNRWDRNNNVMYNHEGIPFNGAQITLINGISALIEVISRNQCNLIPVYDEHISKGEWWKIYSKNLEENPGSLKNVVGDFQEMMNSDQITIIREWGQFNLFEQV